jgi:CubicO group peptidase (beta-lactamase class C family)
MTLPRPARDGFERAAAVINDAVDAGVFPGAVLLVAQHGAVLQHAAFGSRSLEPQRTPMERDTVFDLSSLTKPLATTTALMLLVREGKLRVEDRVTRFIPNFGVYGKTAVSVRHLLAHCSGLAAWRPFHREIADAARNRRPHFLASRSARESIYEEIHRARLEYPPASRSLYSDLGFLLLGELVELVAGTTLDRFCHERVFRRLGLRSTGFVDLERLRQGRFAPVTSAIAPTERCPWRGKVLCGEVHDDNAWAAGGVAGHAGLFANAADVHALVCWLRACARGEDSFLPADLVRRFWTRDALVPGSTWALGWDTPSPAGSSAGSRVSPHAVGHLGFTGTSLWIDLERDAHVIFLTNRIHPSRRDERIRDVRPRVHDAVWEALDA